MSDPTTIEEALGVGHWYGASKVAFLNSAGDLVLQRRHVSGPRMRTEPTETRVVKGNDAVKIKALHDFGVDYPRRYPRTRLRTVAS